MCTELPRINEKHEKTDKEKLLRILYARVKLANNEMY